MECLEPSQGKTSFGLRFSIQGLIPIQDCLASKKSILFEQGCASGTLKIEVVKKKLSLRDSTILMSAEASDRKETAHADDS